MNNPIVEKFNKENLNYILKLNENKWTPANSYILCDKQGSFAKEFDIGNYGCNIPKVFPVIEKLFTKIFGNGDTNEFKPYGEYGPTGKYTQWKYEGYILDLRDEPEHPRTSGSHLRIYITEKV